jgi:small subunit ribosomal protein S20
VLNSSSEEVFGLPNIKSAKKRVLVNAAKTAQNRAAKSAVKTDLKKFEVAVVGGNRSEAEGAYKVAVKAVDQAVGHGLLHKNNAARKKSSMTVKLNKLA